MTENVRNKWFVSSSNSAKQRELDNLIKDRYSVLLQSLLNDARLLNEWKTSSPYSCLAAIIVLDQFSRHIFREEMNEKVRGQRPTIDGCDALALDLSKFLFSSKEKKSNLLSTTLTVPQYVFALMPFRHSAKQENIEFVMNQLMAICSEIWRRSMDSLPASRGPR